MNELSVIGKIQQELNVKFKHFLSPKPSDLLLDLNDFHNVLTARFSEQEYMKNYNNNICIWQPSNELLEMKPITCYYEIDFNTGSLVALSSELNIIKINTTSDISHLIHIDLSDNNLIVIPECISEFKNLRSLDLIFNDISVFPEHITELINLTALFLDDNKLKEIPETIVKMINLRDFNISSNCLKDLPESMGEMTQLTTLDIRYNKFEGRGQCLDKLKQGTIIIK